jgi:hypothetical protein
MAGQIGLLESWQRFRYDGEINTFVIVYILWLFRFMIGQVWILIFRVLACDRE